MQRNLFKTAKATAPAFLCWLCCLCCFGCLLYSCGEETEEDTEFANWQQRNEAFFATLEDSLAAQPAQWLKFKSYTKDPSMDTGTAADCVYAKVLQQGDGGETPIYTDSVRVSYRGRLIPTENYPGGYIFDATAYSNFDARTNATVKMAISGNLVDGFTTILQHMHRGDTWRVYIPYQLGYGTIASGSIPAYSTLVFELSLIDFSHVGQKMNDYSARKLKQ